MMTSNWKRHATNHGQLNILELRNLAANEVVAFYCRDRKLRQKQRDRRVACLKRDTYKVKQRAKSYLTSCGALLCE